MLKWVGAVSLAEASLAQNREMWAVGVLGSGQGFTAALL